MNDLIWIGNTLYPRWFVLLIFLAIVGSICALVAAIKRPPQ